MIVMRSKQIGVAPLDIRCDAVVCSFCLHLGEATPSSFHPNQELILYFQRFVELFIPFVFSLLLRCQCLFRKF